MEKPNVGRSNTFSLIGKVEESEINVFLSSLYALNSLKFMIVLLNPLSWGSSRKFYRTGRLCE